MKTIWKNTGTRRSRSRRSVRLDLELLESRELLSAVVALGQNQPLAQSVANGTLDQALEIGTLDGTRAVQLVGTIQQVAAGGEVDWYHFSLVAPMTITVDPLSQSHELKSVISLYNDDYANSAANPYTWDSPYSPPFDPTGHALVAQWDQPSNGAGALQWNLTSGDYYIAVSGAGDNFFHPYLPDSGYAGSAGNYRLQLNATSLSTDPGPYAGVGYEPPFAVNGTNVRTGYISALDDTPVTAQQLGDLTHSGLVQVIGSIGDPSGPDGQLINPAAAVDLYHFQVTGGHSMTLTSEVFAGRIGSTLDPGLSLFEMNAYGQLQLITSNSGSENTTVASDSIGSIPLFSDPVLFATLTAGDYYLAVSGAGNVPGNGPGMQPGTNGIFDPNISQSGQNGFTTGFYVLNVQLQDVQKSAHVTGVFVQNSLSNHSMTPVPAGAVLSAPPTQLVIQFSEALTPSQVADLAFTNSTQGTGAPVFLVDQNNGSTLFPSFESYDPATCQATYLMLDRLNNDRFQLHLAGSLGLSPSNPLDDYVLPFSVQNAGNTKSENLPPGTQDIGIVFPNDLLAGVSIYGTIGPATSANPANAEYYRFQVLQSQAYQFGFAADEPALQLTLDGTPLEAYLPVELAAGAYTLGVLGAPSTAMPYTLLISALGEAETPPPLSIGPAPVIQVRLLSADPAVSSAVAGPAGSSVASSVGQPGPGSPIPASVYQALGSNPFSEVALVANRAGASDAFDQVFVQAPPVPGNPSFVQTALFIRNSDSAHGPDAVVIGAAESGSASSFPVIAAAWNWIAGVLARRGAVAAPRAAPIPSVIPSDDAITTLAPPRLELSTPEVVDVVPPVPEDAASAATVSLAMAPASPQDQAPASDRIGVWNKLFVIGVITVAGVLARTLLSARKPVSLLRRPAPPDLGRK